MLIKNQHGFRKVLILGANGNLGQQLVKVFGENCDVVSWDRAEIDITDKELIIKKINDIKPDVIINAAAYNAVDKCEEDEEEFNAAKKLNGEAPGFLAEGALAVGAVLVHYSTDYVFKGDNREGYAEDDEPNPISNYGRSKLMGERAIIELSGQGLKWLIIRTSKLFGPKGESEMTKPSFFDIMLGQGKESGRINVVDEEVSCFTYTPDLAKVTKDLLDKKSKSGIYHIVNAGPCTWYEAARVLFKTADLDVKVNPVTGENFSRPAKRPKYSVLKSTKLEPLRDWKDALGEYLKI